MNVKIDETEITLIPESFIAFYADIPHQHIDEVITDLKEFYKEHKYYLIGLEYAEAREHMHFVVDFTDKAYTAYVKRVLKGKYKLSGRRNQKGHTGGFGKVSKIKDFEAMCSYTIKDLDYRTNFPTEFIEKVKLKSYPKEDTQRELLQQCMTQVKWDLINNDDATPMEIATKVIDFMRSKEHNIVSTVVRRYTLYYMTYEQKTPSFILANYLFPHGI